MMKKIYVLMVVLIAVSFAVPAEAGVKWLPLREGMERAKAEKKSVIVDYFFGKGCPRCESLQKNVYDNAEISKKIMDDFIPIRIDLSKKLTPEEEEFGNKYDYKNDCLLLFLDHNGKVIKGPGGKRLCFIDDVGPEAFTEYLEFIKGMIGK